MRRDTPQQGNGPPTAAEADGVDKDAQRDRLADAGVSDEDVAFQGQTGGLDGEVVDGFDDGEDVDGLVAGFVDAGDGG